MGADGKHRVSEVGRAPQEGVGPLPAGRLQSLIRTLKACEETEKADALRLPSPVETVVVDEYEHKVLPGQAPGVPKAEDSAWASMIVGHLDKSPGWASHVGLIFLNSEGLASRHPFNTLPIGELRDFLARNWLEGVNHG